MRYVFFGLEPEAQDTTSEQATASEDPRNEQVEDPFGGVKARKMWADTIRIEKQAEVIVWDLTPAQEKHLLKLQDLCAAIVADDRRKASTLVQATFWCPHMPKSLRDRIHTLTEIRVGFDTASVLDNWCDVDSKLTLRDTYSGPWFSGYQNLWDAVDQNNGQVPVRTHQPQAKHILSAAAFVHNQRAAYAADTLSSKRKQLLELIPGWSWRADEHLLSERDASWRGNLSAWQAYWAEHGEEPPQTTSEGAWAKNQRQRKAKLAQWQLSLLQADPHWKWPRC